MVDEPHHLEQYTCVQTLLSLQPSVGIVCTQIFQNKMHQILELQLFLSLYSEVGPSILHQERAALQRS